MFVTDSLLIAQESASIEAPSNSIVYNLENVDINFGFIFGHTVIYSDPKEKELQIFLIGILVWG